VLLVKTIKKRFAMKAIIAISFIIVAAKIENELIDIAPYISEVPTAQKVVALTFDDGPLDITTPKILKILKEKQAKATFFVLGECAEKYPELIREEVAEGHEVGNHTFDHRRLSNLSEPNVDEEIKKTEETLLEVAPKPTLFRPPQGRLNKTTVRIARDLGYLIILWSVDPQDWRYPPVGTIVNNVMNNVRPGSIILLHDGKYPSVTPEALYFIIDELQARGYKLVTVSELLQYYEEQVKRDKVTY